MSVRRERSVLDEAPLLVAPELATRARLERERETLRQRLAGLPRHSRRSVATELRLQSVTAQILSLDIALRRRP